MVGADVAYAHSHSVISKKQSIRAETIVRKMTATKESKHNSTTAQAEKEQKITMY